MRTQSLLSLCALLPAAALAAGPIQADETVTRLKTPEGVAVTLFAAEPQLTNPTNIDVDHRGRVWVCDVMNYRGNQGSRPEGDRILILEDADGDGRADSSKVFYQGPEVDSALGICVLPDPDGKTSRVIVSCSPNVWLFTDEDGDDKPDRREAIFTKTGTGQHDHNAHALVFGPDGQFYWNIGNEHSGVFDAQGKVVNDIFGREVRPDGKPYWQGMAFRMNLNLTGNAPSFSHFEVLAHNLRNSYELTVNSFGDVWFTDNDDDGNRGTRLCYTLPGGNYGYVDELTGQHWRAHQWTNMSEEIPRRHWHQNDPGVVPNVANLGAGSPSGIVMYEGGMFPDLRGKLIHCEPGHNVVRSFTIHPQGAGYRATYEPSVDGKGDAWFRPVVACVPPDGSIFVADWYDPGVGGHGQGDLGRGRIYRVAAKPQATGQAPTFDFTTSAGAVAALTSGCQSVRYTAWTALAAMGAKAEAALTELANSDDPVLRARAYWLLSRLPNKGAEYVKQAASDESADVRAAAVRMARQRGEAGEVVAQLLNDSSPQVRRACVIALRYVSDPDIAIPLWRQLASGYEGGDRWFVEALGLTAENLWDGFLPGIADDPWGELDYQNRQAGIDLICRARGRIGIMFLSRWLTDPETPREILPRLLRTLDYVPADIREAVLASAVSGAIALPEESRYWLLTESLKRIKARPLEGRTRSALKYLLREIPHDARFVELVQMFRVKERYDDVLTAALGDLADTDEGVAALRFLLDEQHTDAIEARLAEPEENRTLVRMLANSNHAAAAGLLQPLALKADASEELRREAIRAVAAQRSGAARLVELAEQGELAAPMVAAVAYAVVGSPWEDLRTRARALSPELSAASGANLPVAEWMQRGGDAGRGEKLFFGKANCSTCHQVGARGKRVGPGLDGIGAKLSRRGLYEALLYPSAAISHNYQAYLAVTDRGVAVTGVLIGETDQTVTLKTEKDVTHEFRRDELEALEAQPVSLMPAGLERTLDPQELADLAAYLATLKSSHHAPHDQR